MKEIVKYYKDGNIKERYTINERGKKQGIYESFYKNGQKKEVCNYIDGKLNGLYEKFYNNGQKYIVCTYIDGKLEGTYKEFYRNGQLFVVCNYVNGVNEGLHELFFSKYNRKAEATYENGKLNGISVLKDKNNDILLITFYKNNEVVKNPVFVVGNTIFTANEYKQAYNSGNNEFREMKVKGFETLSDAEKYLSTEYLTTNLTNDKTKDKIKKIEIDR